MSIDSDCENSLENLLRPLNKKEVSMNDGGRVMRRVSDVIAVGVLKDRRRWMSFNLSDVPVAGRRFVNGVSHDRHYLKSVSS